MAVTRQKIVQTKILKKYPLTDKYLAAVTPPLVAMVWQEGHVIDNSLEKLEFSVNDDLLELATDGRGCFVSNTVDHNKITSNYLSAMLVYKDIVTLYYSKAVIVAKKCQFSQNTFAEGNLKSMFGEECDTLSVNPRKRSTSKRIAPPAARKTRKQNADNLASRRSIEDELPQHVQVVPVEEMSKVDDPPRVEEERDEDPKREEEAEERKEQEQDELEEQEDQIQEGKEEKLEQDEQEDQIQEGKEEKLEQEEQEEHEGKAEQEEQEEQEKKDQLGELADENDRGGADMTHPINDQDCQVQRKVLSRKVVKDTLADQLLKKKLSVNRLRAKLDKIIDDDTGILHTKEVDSSRFVVNDHVESDFVKKLTDGINEGKDMSNFDQIVVVESADGKLIVVNGKKRALAYAACTARMLKVSVLKEEYLPIYRLRQGFRPSKTKEEKFSNRVMGMNALLKEMGLLNRMAGKYTDTELKNIFERVLADYPLELIKLCLTPVLSDCCTRLSDSWPMSIRSMRKLNPLFQKNPKGTCDALEKFAKCNEKTQKILDNILDQIDVDSTHMLSKKGATCQVIDQCLQFYVNDSEFAAFTKSGLKTAKNFTFDNIQSAFEQWKISKKSTSVRFLTCEEAVEIGFDLYVVTPDSFLDISKLGAAIVFTTPPCDTMRDGAFYIFVPDNFSETHNSVLLNLMSATLRSVRNGVEDTLWLQNRLKELGKKEKTCFTVEELLKVLSGCSSVFFENGISSGLVRLLSTEREKVAASSVELSQMLSSSLKVQLSK